jgi:hypothetical protein
MDLPVRILDSVPRERVISVDGAFDAPGLNLSHWPGNRTPSALKHDLSTGIALAFSRLPRPEQEALARGCTAIVNNHYDTDGMCSLLAVGRPALALPRAEALLAAAAAGDFFQLPSEAAFVVDVIVTGVVDPESSPWRGRFAGASDRDRREIAMQGVLDELPAWLDGDVAGYEEMWRAPLERLREDRAALGACARDELVHLDFTVWTAPRGARSPAMRESFDPGRHALFGATASDRILVLGPTAGGTSCRFLLSTLSWFDLVSRSTQPRPDLARLAERLNALEGTSEQDEIAWRAQATESPSPELWFGRASLDSFAERASDALAPSTLDPQRMKAEILDELRASWVFPETSPEPATPR